MRLAGKVKNPFTPKEDDPSLYAHVETLALEAGMAEALRIPEKLARKEARASVKKRVKEMLAADPRMGGKRRRPRRKSASFSSIWKRSSCVSASSRKEPVLTAATRKTVRPIEIETGVLPRAHGSVIFARGETKSLAVTTLGSTTDEQRVDSLKRR